jgi:hypothetical protein
MGGAADPQSIELSADTDQSPAHVPNLIDQAMPRTQTPGPPLPRSKGPLMAMLLGVVLLGSIGAYLFWPAPAPPLVIDPPKLAEPVKVIEPAVIEPPKAVEPVIAEPPKSVEVAPERVKPAEPVKAAVLRVTSVPPMEVVVDKKSWGITPVDVEVAAGKHTLVLQNRDLGLSQTTQYRLGAGEKRDHSWVAARGKLLVHVEPFGNIAIGGRVIRKASSVADEDLWEGRYALIVSNEELKKSITRTVDVKGGQTTELRVNLFTDEK